ncbi:MAG: hypothetical protein EBR62_09535, partial [Verrucomicrobia bacterium]|nr:hypothetical protein [Verrucomicrobiota bacterium]
SITLTASGSFQSGVFKNLMRPDALAGSLAALLLLVGHVAFAINAFGMILASTTPTSEGRHD